MIFNLFRGGKKALTVGSLCAGIRSDSQGWRDSCGHGRKCDIRPEHINEAIQYRGISRNLMV